MKFERANDFCAYLAKTQPQESAPVYMILGIEDAERKDAVDALIRSLLGEKGITEDALKTLDAEKLTFSALFDELNANSLFAKRRVIHVRHADKLADSIAKRMESYYADPNSAVTLIFSAPSVNRSTNFYKKAEKAGIVLDIPELKPWEKAGALANFAGELFSRQGKAALPPVSQYLVERIGANSALLQSEIDKLVCYVGERKEITREDIEAVCINESADSGWQLGDAIFQKDAKSALKIARALLEQEGSMIAIARQLRSQFQVKCRICDILASGKTPSDVQKLFPYMRGNILQKNVQMAQNYGLRKCMKGLLAIDEMEALAKSSSLTDELITEYLIFKLL